MRNNIVSIPKIPEFVNNATSTLQEYSDKPLYTLTISQLSDLIKLWVYQFQTEVLGDTASEPRYLTRKATAKLLHISLPTLDKYTELGIIQGQRVGSRILYKEDAIEEACKAIETKKYQG
ncbi:MAG TPA: hypothetical protein DDW27_18220 [Bacteroidales bacterium]|nr:hypothetical protein [Bacteroidales bacterium]